jgi:hypothetical protein
MESYETFIVQNRRFYEPQLGPQLAITLNGQAASTQTPPSLKS